ncbi:sugar ABC transporter permease [Paenibacillus barengoltzii]|uniref:carbohydrate ABC transporter permease n=1 Tax=Paenibacillus barengoltzii TaxID=343517 RepID=UPI000A085CEA|nr:sugar ABC transporter permease [Paenibacillus barengoltzii]MEC2343636.1 sugar ABC transporter permease [Paenibacillus barengoltzii]SMF13656.1 carbohydrate ABC transporter membrane protein 1, CUT1 family (TC 3.A.1.1.-) [Paenibacillus barengoltzii]
MKKSNIAWTNYLYLLPAVLLVAVFFATSIVYTVRLSFYEYDGFSVMRFVGIENYRHLFQDANFKISLMNTVIWVVFSLVFTLALPLLLAVFIKNSSWVGGFKNIFYYPTALSSTIGGIIMVAILSKYGIPQLFGLLGFKSWVRDWLAIPYVNTFIMILMGTWQGVGLNTILFITGLTTIPSSPIEAAKIEGARTIQLYTKVIFPLLQPTTVVVLLMSLVNSFKVFDSIWVMTKGGPYRTSETLALTMYQESFIHGKFGVGAAVAVVLTVMILIVSYFNIRNTFGDTDRTV